MRLRPAGSFRFCLALAGFLAAAGVCAQAAETAEPAAAAAPGVKSEPNVQRIVSEDDNVHVEELRVRGETKRIVVQSRLGRSGKVGRYEVLPADNGRDMSQGPAGRRDAAGQRVWNVFAF